MLLFLSLVSALGWIGLLIWRGGFWRADQRLPGDAGVGVEDWPAVAAVIPARDEAATIAVTVSSLLGQNYPGRLTVLVVDDSSTDGTAEAALRAGQGDPRLSVIGGLPLPEGWTGKLWAVAQGVERASSTRPEAAFLLLTDADIAHDRGNLRRLVSKATGEGLDLVSLMVRLRCESFWEKLLIPAFVFFFQKLFPFPWVNRPDRRTAAAAGGCMLVRRDALEAAGGIASIRDRLIDDCALAALLKARGRIWLGLSDETLSLRRYDRLSEIARMVARTAFEQLDHSFLRLAGTVVGMVLLYVMPPVALGWSLWSGNAAVAVVGGAGWLAMAVAYRPTLRLYGRALPWALSLPLAGVLYCGFTLDSVRRTWRGQGGSWKGRSYRTSLPGKG